MANASFDCPIELFFFVRTNILEFISFSSIIKNWHNDIVFWVPASRSLTLAQTLALKTSLESESLGESETNAMLVQIWHFV